MHTHHHDYNWWAKETEEPARYIIQPIEIYTHIYICITTTIRDIKIEKKKNRATGKNFKFTSKQMKVQELGTTRETHMKILIPLKTKFRSFCRFRKAHKKLSKAFIP